MNLTLTNDMTINYVHNGVSVVLDKIIYQHGQISDIAYQRGSSPTPNINALTFTAQQANSTISLSSIGSPDPISLEYSTDNGATWANYVIGNTISLVNVNDNVKFRGNNTTICKDYYSNYYKFIITGQIYASGDLTSLLNGTGGDVSLPFACFGRLFMDCSGLFSTPNLPSTTFTGSDCYTSLFQNCTGLTNINENLLPATIISDGIYSHMFEGCSNLTESPLLPALTLGSYCYYCMFQGCSKLNKITCLATSISANMCLGNWVDGVASSGTFTKNTSMTSWSRGVSGIPSGWTVQNYI